MSNDTTFTDVQACHKYRLRHSRFGRADVLVLCVDGEWIDVRVIAGTLRGMCDMWIRGDEKRVRREDCHFTEIGETAK
jgi:hypothetical protein